MHSIGDLIPIESTVKAAFSYEFMDRKDGYPGLVESYHLSFNPKNINRMEHALSYQAIDKNAVDLIDVYSTDAKIKKLNLRVLRDDHNYFPVYQAVWVARKSFVEKHPRAWTALLGLEGKISAEAMIDMNAQASQQRSASIKLPRGSWAPKIRNRRAGCTKSRAAPRSICGWWGCRCCFPCWSAYRSA